MRFRDRRHAGELLGAKVADLEPWQPVVYALPRGGVPVAHEVSRALRCPLDVLVVRKVGVPFQPELAMGAVAEGAVIIRNDDVLRLAGVADDTFDSVASAERRELEARVGAYRAVAPPISPEGHTAVVVDDGLATGSTARAAIEVLKQKGAASVWLAVPVGPAHGLEDLEATADRLVILRQPASFGAVGYWYRNFAQTSDEEVQNLLASSRLA